tara:strand:- start:762 stop:869 length:108 start_codon:yes stop_codon:yes gene_type:complete
MTENPTILAGKDARRIGPASSRLYAMMAEEEKGGV